MTFSRLKVLLYRIAVVVTTSTALVWITSAAAPTVAGGTPLLADAMACDLAQYKSSPGLAAAMDQNVLAVAWTGQNGSEMRARYAIDGGQPIVRDLAVRRTGGQWVTLGQNLTPEYRVVSGIRRMSTQQADPLKAAGVELTPDVIARNRWYAFWDAPLVMKPGREIIGPPQHYEFGGVIQNTSAPVKAQNRLLVAEGKGASLGTFTPPHTFFFTREVDTNLGYVWYRKDSATTFGIGIRQADAEETPQYADNFALFNAPPGTVQHMGVYFYASPDSAEGTRQAVLRFTHGDEFKPLPGYKTFVNHFHLRFTERLRASGSFDTPMQDLAAMKALGLNIIGLSDFHGDMHPNDPGPLRFKDQKDYFEATRRASDRDFLVTPWEEPSAFFGGHYNIIFPRNVYWSKVRQPGQPLTETDPVFGKVYHTGSAEDVQQMMDAEGAYWYHAHPRTKGTTGYPDLIFDKAWTRNDRYLGSAFKPGMGMDLSETRLCEWRCFDATDTMNNLYAGSGLRPKYIIADIDTYQKGPEDDLYPNFPVNYLKLDRVPGPDDDWSPVLRAIRDGQFFVSTGEILIRSYSVEGSGDRRTVSTDVEWTFPLSFVEVVWGDGKKIDRQVMSATDLSAFGSKHFALPFAAKGKAWVRFAVWDSAGNGAFVQPVWLR